MLYFLHPLFRQNIQPGLSSVIITISWQPIRGQNCQSLNQLESSIPVMRSILTNEKPEQEPISGTICHSGDPGVKLRSYCCLHLRHFMKDGKIWLRAFLMRVSVSQSWRCHCHWHCWMSIVKNVTVLLLVCFITYYTFKSARFNSNILIISTNLSHIISISCSIYTLICPTQNIPLIKPSESRLSENLRRSFSFIQ